MQTITDREHHMGHSVSETMQDFVTPDYNWFHEDLDVPK
jgi:hypothetical protein